MADSRHPSSDLAMLDVATSATTDPPTPGGRSAPPGPLRGVVVVGTDLGVGTTTVVGGLALAVSARGERVGVFKPFETGCSITRDGRAPVSIDGIPGELSPEARRAYARLNELVGPPSVAFSTKTANGALHPRDASWLLELLCDDDQARELETISPYRYSAEVAPAVAARLAERPIDLEHLLDCLVRVASRSDAVVVDGGGGLCEPLADDGPLLLDFIARSGLPVLLVGPSRRGVVAPILAHHLLLEARGIALAGIVLVRHDRKPRVEEAANPLLIEALAGDVVRGVLPFLEDERRAQRETLGARFALHVDVERILPRSAAGQPTFVDDRHDPL